MGKRAALMDTRMVPGVRGGRAESCSSVEARSTSSEQSCQVSGATQSSASVKLVRPPASSELRLITSSSETMRMVELFELQAREGPCLDAFRTGARVEH